MPDAKPTIPVTVDFRAVATPGAEPTRPMTVAVAPAPDRPQPADEIRDVLRKRLMFLARVMACGVPASILFYMFAGAGVEIDKWAASAGAVFVWGMILTGVLSARPGLTLCGLRRVELALFGALYLECCFVHFYLYATMRPADPPA